MVVSAHKRGGWPSASGARASGAAVDERVAPGGRAMKRTHAARRSGVGGRRPQVCCAATLALSILVAGDRLSLADGSGGGPGPAAGAPVGGSANLCEKGDKVGAPAQNRKMPCTRCDPPPVTESPKPLPPPPTKPGGSAGPSKSVSPPGPAITPGSTQARQPVFTVTDTTTTAFSDGHAGSRDGTLLPERGAFACLIDLVTPGPAPLRPPDT